VSENGVHFLEEVIVQENRAYRLQELFEVAVFVVSLVQELNDAKGHGLRILDAKHAGDL